MAVRKSMCRAGICLSEPLHQLVALVACGGIGLHAGMCLVNYDQFRACAQEVGPAAVRLDVVERDHRKWVDFEDRFVGSQPAFQACCCPGSHHLRFDVELRGKLLLPLLAEVRRTDHGNALYLAPIEQFTGNESRFDGLADADIVGNQEPQGIELERHQQRHKLVSTRLDRDVAEAAEQTSPTN